MIIEVSSPCHSVEHSCPTRRIINLAVLLKEYLPNNVLLKACKGYDFWRGQGYVGGFSPRHFLRHRDSFVSVYSAINKPLEKFLTSMLCHWHLMTLSLNLMCYHFSHCSLSTSMLPRLQLCMKPLICRNTKMRMRFRFFGAFRCKFAYGVADLLCQSVFCKVWCFRSRGKVYSEKVLRHHLSVHTCNCSRGILSFSWL